MHVIHIGGGLASLFTVGLGEGVDQAAEAAMVANTDSKAADILAGLFEAATISEAFTSSRGSGCPDGPRANQSGVDRSRGR